MGSSRRKARCKSFRRKGLGLSPFSLGCPSATSPPCLTPVPSVFLCPSSSPSRRSATFASASTLYFITSRLVPLPSSSPAMASSYPQPLYSEQSRYQPSSYPESVIDNYGSNTRMPSPTTSMTTLTRVRTVEEQLAEETSKKPVSNLARRVHGWSWQAVRVPILADFCWALPSFFVSSSLLVWVPAPSTLLCPVSRTGRVC
jgi:hypothetical protein